jgi:DNA polymerase-4
MDPWRAWGGFGRRTVLGGSFWVVDRPRTLLHADMDAFYASVEQRDDPSIRGKPVIVGGIGGRGVVSAASYEAREFGVHSAMPTYEARRRCPNGIYLRGDMARYSRESRRIFEVFGRFTPAVEGLSLDEAFLDLTGTERLHGSARQAAERLRGEVFQEIGLVVSVGIAPVKMVAKIASALAKPDGLLEVRPAEVRGFLDPLPVGRLWGVGPVARERFEAAGLRTIGDLARADPKRLGKVLGDWGGAVAALARGEDVREVEPWRDPVSISEENTFAADVGDEQVQREAIIAHAEAVARRLRRSGYRARTVVLKWKMGRRVRSGARGYPLLSRRVTLPQATDDGAELSARAQELLAAVALSEPIRLIGVGVTNLEAAEAGQLTLFEPGETSRRRRLNRALDSLADRFGARAVVRGGGGEVVRAGLSLQIKRGGEDE